MDTHLSDRAFVVWAVFVALMLCLILSLARRANEHRPGIRPTPTKSQPRPRVVVPLGGRGAYAICDSCIMIVPFGTTTPDPAFVISNEYT